MKKFSAVFTIVKEKISSEVCLAITVRLRKTNAARARDFESCMSGQIAEIGGFVMRLMEGVKRVDEEQER